VRIRLWGTRGSLAAPGGDTARYGGNTACVEVRDDDAVLVLDAGTGIRPLGAALAGRVGRVDLLVSHFHLDHIQGLGFFRPLFDPEVETHLWGPAATIADLRARLSRYLSPPLFPVRLRDLPRLVLHVLPDGPFDVAGFRVTADRICHPGTTVGFRIERGRHAMAYLPDHEPVLGTSDCLREPEWTSGWALARDADLLVHDAQYTAEEYADRVGWGHSTLEHAIAFATLAGVRHLVTFHHDPAHADDDIDGATAAAMAAMRPEIVVTAGAEGAVFTLRG
jgi:phosphoribosyl 1,2-cyclic phosphodiesterase